MGLDMYAYATKREVGGVDFESSNEDRQFGYWRKFNNLHGWMKQLYLEKGGKNADFNGDKVQLTEDDLHRLKAEAPNLEPTEGFFFGELEAMTKEDVETVNSFVEEALAEIEAGNRVYYDSWW